MQTLNSPQKGIKTGPPSPAKQQRSRAHDKQDLYNTCIVSQLSQNKYCLNQETGPTTVSSNAWFDWV